MCQYAVGLQSIYSLMSVNQSRFMFMHMYRCECDGGYLPPACEEPILTVRISANTTECDELHPLEDTYGL